MTELYTPSEVALMLATRDVLQVACKRLEAGERSRELGRTIQAADAAQAALFTAVNIANAYGHCDSANAALAARDLTARRTSDDA